MRDSACAGPAYTQLGFDAEESSDLVRRQQAFHLRPLPIIGGLFVVVVDELGEDVVSVQLFHGGRPVPIRSLAATHQRDSFEHAQAAAQL